MKILSTLILAILLLSSFTAKGPTFSLADKQVSVGAVYTLKATFDQYSHNLNAELESELDQVASFLTKKKLKIEIGVHANKSGTGIMTAERASAIVDYLSKRGVKRSSMVAVGYADKDPVVTQRELYKLKTLAEKTSAKKKNERAEIKILSVK